MRVCTKDNLLRMTLILLSSAALGTLLLVLAFCIPTDAMRSNVAESLDSMIKSEEEIPDGELSHYIWKNKETYTDAIMVQNAVEKISGRNVYEHAMWIYHNDLEPEFWTPEASLRAFCEGETTDNMYLHEYSRYWHGYLIYLKPLLLVFSWSQIVVIGAVIQLFLLLAVIIISVKKKQAGVGIATVIGFFFMKPLLILASLTMSVCWCITLSALLVMLSCHERLEKKRLYPEAFLLIGIFTSYFDFLTYPIVTLGFPLCAYFLIERKCTLKQSFLKIIGYCTCWGTGYAGMWAFKWLIADVTLHTGTIKDALWSVLGRTESIGGRPRMNGGFYVISLNLQEYKSELYAVAAVLVLLAFAAVLLAAFRTSAKETILRMAPFAVIFCIPFIWIIVVQHHSALHARFTFRILGVAALALCCIVTAGLQTLKKPVIEKQYSYNMIVTK